MGPSETRQWPESIYTGTVSYVIVDYKVFPEPYEKASEQGGVNAQANPQDSARARGPSGAGGLPGPALLQAPPGCPLSRRSSYAFVYNLSEQAVDIGQNVMFDSDGAIMGGITHDLGSSVMAISEPGHYYVAFGATGQGAYQLSLVSGDKGYPLMTVGSGEGVQQCSGQAIICVEPEHLPFSLALGNRTTAGPIRLACYAGGAGRNVNAYLLVLKLD